MSEKILGTPIVAPMNSGKFNNVGITPVYSAGASYSVGDTAVYKGVLYICKTAIVTPEIWTPAHWDAITVAEQLTEQKEDLTELKEKKLDKAVLEFIYRKAKALYDRSEGQEFDILENTQPGYSKTVPAGVVGVLADMIGGKSVVWNQLTKNSSFINTSDWSFQRCSWTVNDGNAIINATADFGGIVSNSSLIPIGHKFIACYELNSDADEHQIRFFAGGLFAYNISSSSWQKVIIFGESISANPMTIYDMRQNAWTEFEVRKPFAVDLTLLFGEGNEPTELSDPRIARIEAYLVENPEYNDGEIVSANVTGFESVNGGLQIDRKNLPEALLTYLEDKGYGMGVGSVYNELNFETKKYIQRVASRAYEAGDESDTSVLTDGTTTVYPLETPVEYPLESYLTEEFVLEAAAGGQFIFSQSNELKLDIPNKLEYLVNEARVIT